MNDWIADHKELIGGEGTEKWAMICNNGKK